MTSIDSVVFFSVARGEKGVCRLVWNFNPVARVEFFFVYASSRTCKLEDVQTRGNTKRAHGCAPFISKQKFTYKRWASSRP